MEVVHHAGLLGSPYGDADGLSPLRRDFHEEQSIYSGLLSPSKDREHRLGHRGFCRQLRREPPTCATSIFGWLATFVSLKLHAQPQIPSPQSPTVPGIASEDLLH